MKKKGRRNAKVSSAKRETKNERLKKGVDVVVLKKRHSMCFLHSEGLARATLKYK